LVASEAKREEKIKNEHEERVKLIKPTETTRTKVLRSAVWTTGAKILGQCTTLITTFVLVRLLMKEDFGLMAMALTYSGFIDNFIDFGFLSAIIQAKEVTSRQLNSCFWFLMTGVLFVGGASFWGAALIAQMFAEPRIKSMIEVLALLLLLIPVQIICRGLLSKALRLDTIAKLELSASITRASTSVVFAYTGAGVWSLLYGYMAEKVMLAAVFPIAAKWRPRFEYELSGVRQLLSFGMNVSAGTILWYIFNQSDVFIIGRLLGAETLGVYSVALQIATGIYQFLCTTWSRIVYPLFSKYQQSKQLATLFVKTSSFFALVTFPLCLGLAAMAPDIVRVLLGERWVMATFPLQMLSIMTAFRTVSSLVPSLLNSIGRPGENIKVNLFSCVIFTGTFYVAARWIGLDGVLWSWVILYPLRYLVLLAIAFKFIQLPAATYAKAHLGTIAATALMFFVVVMVRGIGIGWHIYIRMALCVILGAVTYLGLQAFLSRKLIAEFLSFIKGPVYHA
jgi:teichuronic acid exporter